MKFDEKTYLAHDPFSGADRDTDVRHHKVKIVTVRKEHDCFLSPLLGESMHKILPGQKARNDTALVEDKWGSYYTCLECMDKWLIEDCGLSETEK